jgi:riboflavin synthase
MFTGIIEGLGIITGFRTTGGGRRLTVEAGFNLNETQIGDSIAVNGACLTVIETDDRRFSADISPETLAITTFQEAKIGQRVNIERAMRLSDRIDGHLVSGHIDNIGTIRSLEKQGNAIIVTVAVPEQLGEQMIPKGSVAIDGISLTINTCDLEHFTVSIIPHTAKVTTISFYRSNARVNIETDIIGKYVAHFTNATRAVNNENREEDKTRKASTIDMAFLNSSGFL